MIDVPLEQRDVYELTAGAQAQCSSAAFDAASDFFAPAAAQWSGRLCCAERALGWRGTDTWTATTCSPCGAAHAARGREHSAAFVPTLAKAVRLLYRASNESNQTLARPPRNSTRPRPAPRGEGYRGSARMAEAPRVVAYTADVSICSQIARLALAEHGITPEHVHVDMCVTATPPSLPSLSRTSTSSPCSCILTR